jgi:hypothetical protein
MIRKLLTEMGGRTWLLAVGFSMVAMTTATALIFRAEFDSSDWLSALKTCGILCAVVMGKRAVEEASKAFGKNGGHGPA